MLLEKYFESISDKLSKSANIKTVFGDPISAEGKTIIPVAKIGYGFGGGAEKEKNEEEAGGGGGIGAKPMGVVEITPEKTRFISFPERKKLAAAIAAGFLIGYWFAKRRQAF